MAVGVYVRDFGLGVAGAAVHRSEEHTVVVIDSAVPPLQRYDILREQLHDDEARELWSMWDDLT